MNITYETHSSDDTFELGQRLGKSMKPGQLIFLTGGLGVGKTCFCAGLANGLGCVDAAHSPTFAIVNVYRGQVPFAHFDAYRLEESEDIEATGVFDYLEDGMVVAVEWSEKVRHLLPKPNVTVDISLLPNGLRRICIDGVNNL